MSFSRLLSDTDKMMYKMVYDDYKLASGKIERRQAITALIELGLDEETIERRFKERVSKSTKLSDVSEMEYGAWLELASPDPADAINMDDLQIEDPQVVAVQQALRKAFDVLEPDEKDTVPLSTITRMISDHYDEDRKAHWLDNLKADAPGGRTSFKEYLRVGQMIH